MRRTLAQTPLVRRLLAARDRFRADDLGTMAAALAFQAFLSLFPLMLLTLSVAGFLLAGDPAEWLRRFFDAVPGIGPLLDRNLDAVVEARAGLGLVALVGVAWAASGLTGRASDALGRIFRVPGRGVVRRRARSFVAMLVLGAALFAGLVASAASAAVHAEGWWSLPARALTLVAIAALELAFFAGTYAVLTPPGGPAIRDHLPGAIFMTAGWEVLKLVGGMLVVTVVNRSSALYGTMGRSSGCSSSCGSRRLSTWWAPSSRPCSANTGPTRSQVLLDRVRSSKRLPSRPCRTAKKYRTGCDVLPPQPALASRQSPQARTQRGPGRLKGAGHAQMDDRLGHHRYRLTRASSSRPT